MHRVGLEEGLHAIGGSATLHRFLPDAILVFTAQNLPERDAPVHGGVDTRRGTYWPMSFDLLPAFFMAVLACWLGLSLLVRSPRDRAARAFAWLCLHLTLYGLTIALVPLTVSGDVARLLNRLQVVETVVLPPVFLHFILIVTTPGRLAVLLTAILALFYALAVGMALYALVSPAMLAEARSLRFPPGPLTWLWVAQRALPLLLSLGLVGTHYQAAGSDDLDRRRRRLLAISALVGVAGALLASLARDARLSQAPGHALMVAGLLLMAYTVLAYRLLLPARVAQRAFYRSLLGSLIAALYVAVLLVLEPLAGAWLQIEAPLVTVFALVALVALFGPLRDWAGAWLDRAFFHREFDYGQLLRAVGEDLFERGDLHGQLEAALAAICRTLDVRSGVVAVREGQGLRVIAAYGADRPASDLITFEHAPQQAQTRYDDWPPWPLARLLLPLWHNQESLGLLALGPKRSGEPYHEVERTLLNSLCSYLSLAIRHARTQQAEELAMAALAEQSRQLQAEQELLAAQAAEAARMANRRPPGADAPGLVVHALGPLRVERAGQPIERWGGDKAGTYQAEALFAFLFDRRGRGLTKDEAGEMIWPDLDLDKADAAFHRTLSGLRRTLEPDLRRGNQSRVITYHHERYWLDPAAIGWCDVDAFASAIERGHTLLRRGELEAARDAFRTALELYRGDYMDDCPFFGDSAYVEERRTELRTLQIDALLVLGNIYERLGQAGEAATCYRRALAASRDECPRAEEGLARLQVGIA